MGRATLRGFLLAQILTIGVLTPPLAAAEEAAAPAQIEKPAQPETPVQPYFDIGPWRIGMPHDEALTHFSAVEPIKEREKYRALAPSKFGTVPAVLTFIQGRLETVELTFYEGGDGEAALQSLLAVLKRMDEDFGGANVEGGLKYQKDPQGKLIRTTVDTLTARVDASLDKHGNKTRRAKKDPVSYTLCLNYSTDHQARDNFLYGQYLFDRDLQRLRIKLWEDRAFVESRVPATIYLRPRSQAPL